VTITTSITSTVVAMAHVRQGMPCLYKKRPHCGNYRRVDVIPTFIPLDLSNVLFFHTSFEYTFNGNIDKQPWGEYLF